jgi:hemerythrin-like domain-containing protein
MKIIDKATGKRIGDDSKVDLKKTKEKDPIIRMVNKEEEMEEFSPMDPPEAYDKERVIGFEYGKLPFFLKVLIDEHKEVTEKVTRFDNALKQFKEGGLFINQEINDIFNEFFQYFDNHILPHNKKEEREFFPLLHYRLIESGEHGNGEHPATAVDLMEDDHVKFIQLASLTFNLLGLAMRLPDQGSRMMTFDLAYNTGRELTELLLLHIHRENEVLFPLSSQLIEIEEFENFN